MSDSKIEMKVPEQLITALVQAEIVAALGDQKELVAGVVKAALAQKHYSSDRETLFQKEVNAMIRGVASECFREWLSESKEKIRVSLMRELSKKTKLKALVDNIVANVGQAYPTFTVKFTDGEE